VDARGFGHSGIGLGVGDIERRAIANDLGVRPLGLERLWEDALRAASPASSVLVSAASSI
jgi:hypothetical protein